MIVSCKRFLADNLVRPQIEPCQPCSKKAENASYANHFFTITTGIKKSGESPASQIGIRFGCC